MKCLMVLLLSVMTVVMGSSEPIYSDGYPCLCHGNLLGGDTYQVRRWPWPATYLQSRNSRYNAMANNNANFSLYLLDSMDLGEILVFPDLLERLVRKELRREFVKYLR